MSFRAAKRRGIFPFAAGLRLHPALEIDDTTPQPARPFDCAQGDRAFGRWHAIGFAGGCYPPLQGALPVVHRRAG